uniref:Uncharacterized protein n=1 Tax=Aegilops tauschii TaxID=37682 RepID=M8C779_AEGTA
MAVSLPDDLLPEILVRVKDGAALFRCAMTCKQWRRLVADPCFLRRCWSEDAIDSSCSFVGFFTKGNRHGERDSGPFRGPEPYFVPASPSPLGLRPRALSSFVTPLRAGLFDRAKPLVSRHGLVLVRLEVEAQDMPGYPDKSIFQLAVCNLLVGTCDLLPPLQVNPVFYDHNSNGYSILTSIDCCSKDEPSPPVLPNYSSFFKVVIVSYSCSDLNYRLSEFSSNKESWSMPTNYFNNNAQLEHYGSFSDAIVCRGMLHWIFHDCGEQWLHIINLNVRTGHIYLTKLPFTVNFRPTSHPCLTLGVNGMLSLLWMQKDGSQLEIGEWREVHDNMSGNSECLGTRTIELRQPRKENEGIELCVLREKCGTLLMKNDLNCVYTSDLDTGMMEELVGWPSTRSMCHWDSMPVEIDWLTIFVSRLARDSTDPLSSPSVETSSTRKSKAHDGI